MNRSQAFSFEPSLCAPLIGSSFGRIGPIDLNSQANLHCLKNFDVSSFWRLVRCWNSEFHSRVRLVSCQCSMAGISSIRISKSGWFTSGCMLLRTLKLRRTNASCRLTNGSETMRHSLDIKMAVILMTPTQIFCFKPRGSAALSLSLSLSRSAFRTSNCY